MRTLNPTSGCITVGPKSFAQAMGAASLHCDTIANVNMANSAIHPSGVGK